MKAVDLIEQQGYDNWFVVSEKYGLLSQTELIDQYDITLNNMKAVDRKKWSALVLKQLEPMMSNLQLIDFLLVQNIENT